MLRLLSRMSLCGLLICCIGTTAFSQRELAQYPPSLADAFFSVNVGYINYPFSNVHLEPGFVAESVEIPHTGVRLMLYGRRVNDYLAMQISYMRPVLWVIYRDLNGMQTRNSVWMNVAGLTAVPSVPLGGRFTLFGELGLSIVTRHGFRFDGEPVVKDANYASVLLGTGLKFHLNEKWDLMLHGVYTPANKKARQPHTVFFSPGFQFNMRPLSPEQVALNSTSGYFFPRQQLQFSFSTNAMGYGVNSFFSEGIIPVFWGGSVHVEKGFSVNYYRNVFHGHKTFALDVGAGLSYWETQDFQTPFLTLSVFPILRFNLLRLEPADFFFFYSLAGPTFISKAVIDEEDTGARFTFHDYMGIGVYAGPERHISAEIKIGHYSNGNLFAQNAAVKIPLTFAVGFNF